MLNILKVRVIIEMKKIIFYTKENCLLCDEALELVQMTQTIQPFELEIKDIYEDDKLLEKYQLMIPVIKINETELIGDSIEINNILLKLKE